MPDAQTVKPVTSITSRLGHNFPTIVNVLWVKQCIESDRVIFVKNLPHNSNILRSIAVEIALVPIEPHVKSERSNVFIMCQESWLKILQRLQTENNSKTVQNLFG